MIFFTCFWLYLLYKFPRKFPLINLRPLVKNSPPLSLVNLYPLVPGANRGGAMVAPQCSFPRWRPTSITTHPSGRPSWLAASLLRKAAIGLALVSARAALAALAARAAGSPTPLRASQARHQPGQRACRLSLSAGLARSPAPCLVKGIKSLIRPPLRAAANRKLRTADAAL